MNFDEVQIKDLKIPEHLVGHLNLDEGIIWGLKETYNIKSILDIGCGPSGMEELCKKYQVNFTGIDGDPNVANN